MDWLHLAAFIRVLFTAEMAYTYLDATEMLNWIPIGVSRSEGAHHGPARAGEG
jgi:hypothetical protein